MPYSFEDFLKKNIHPTQSDMLKMTQQFEEHLKTKVTYVTQEYENFVEHQVCEDVRQMG